MFRELSVAQQRYQAVLAVIEDGLQVSEAAAKFGVTRQALLSWLSRYAEGGLEALADRPHRPRSCPGTSAVTTPELTSWTVCPGRSMRL